MPDNNNPPSGDNALTNPPTVPDEVALWWEDVTDNVEALCGLVADWHPARAEWEPHRCRTGADDECDRIHPNQPISAPDAERACEQVRAAIRADTLRKASPGTEFAAAVAARDAWAVYRLLSAAWFGVPESAGCWSLQGFRVACDLLDDFPEEFALEGRTEAEAGTGTEA